MKRKVIYLLIGIIVSISFYTAFINYRNNEDRLFAEFERQIKDDRYEELYAGSPDHVKRSLTKSQFVEKLRDAVSRMRQIDKNLKFQRDEGWEQTTPENFPKEQGFKFTVQKLANKNTSAFVTVYWDDKGFLPKFENITISESDAPDNKWLAEYEFNGIL